MTTASRLDQLLQFYNEDPNDPFNVYALALEYQKSDVSKSLKLFNELIADHPNYIPTYYHLGKLLEANHQREKAKLIFMEGSKKAEEQNDLKALRELRAALLEIDDVDY